MIRITPYYKAAVTGVGEMITTTTAIIALISLAPAQYHGVAVGLSVLLAVLGIAKTALIRHMRDELLLEGITATRDTGPVIDAIHNAAIAITRLAQVTPTTSPTQPPGSQPGTRAQPSESDE
jgi:hypothetical protein